MIHYTISKNVAFELVEKRSKFIANLIYVENKNDAEEKIKELKKQYHDARHNCFAFRVFEGESIYDKSSDDGEPSGTAGAPMLNILQKNNLCNVLVVVTRYFGGILLGTGGLVRSYSGATIGAIEVADKVQIELGIEYEVRTEYSNFKELQYYFQKNNIKITSIVYEQEVVCHIEISVQRKDDFMKDIQSKNVNIKELNYKYIIC